MSRPSFRSLTKAPLTTKTETRKSRRGTVRQLPPKVSGPPSGIVIRKASKALEEAKRNKATASLVIATKAHSWARRAKSKVRSSEGATLDAAVASGRKVQRQRTSRLIDKAKKKKAEAAPDAPDEQK